MDVFILPNRNRNVDYKFPISVYVKLQIIVYVQFRPLL